VGAQLLTLDRRLILKTQADWDDRLWPKADSSAADCRKLSGVKRTPTVRTVAAAFDPKRTSGPQDNGAATCLGQVRRPIRRTGSKAPKAQGRQSLARHPHCSGWSTLVGLSHPVLNICVIPNPHTTPTSHEITMAVVNFDISISVQRPAVAPVWGQFPSWAIRCKSSTRAFSPASLAAPSDLKAPSESLTPSGFDRLLISHAHTGGCPRRLTVTR
jgi:hypothetical protein